MRETICIGLGRPFWYVSFGAELRGWYEAYRNYNWGSGPQDRNGYYLNRIISHGDFHLGPSVRIFAVCRLRTQNRQLKTDSAGGQSNSQPRNHLLYRDLGSFLASK
ncbi:MAG: hypothetical protein WB762_22435 [Candidatus Sulfotelmatobacter sp.]